MFSPHSYPLHIFLSLNSTFSLTSLLLSYTMALQLQAPTTKSHLAPPSPLAAPKGNAGLRQPPDRFALKSSFFSSSHHLLLLSPKQRPLASSAAPKFSMRVASKGAYICRDCGYIYNDRTPFEKLPDKYFCPVCGAPKRRFRPYQPPVNKDANSKDVRKQRKEQLQREEAIGKALPIAVAVGAVALVGLYFYINVGFQG